MATPTQSQITMLIKKQEHKPDELRAYLLKQGCTKGTASKAVTVLVFLTENQIAESDFKSLSAGYDLTRFIKRGWTPST